MVTHQACARYRAAPVHTFAPHRDRTAHTTHVTLKTTLRLVAGYRVTGLALIAKNYMRDINNP